MLEKYNRNLIESTNLYIYSVHFRLDNKINKDMKYYEYLQKKYYQ